MFWHVSVLPSVCPRGGYPYPIMLCNIVQNAMGQTSGGCPARSSQGGYPARSSRGGVPCQGGYPAGGTLLGGEFYPARGGTQLGQQKEYSLHGGRYASCVHAGGLSCFNRCLHNRRRKRECIAQQSLREQMQGKNLRYLLSFQNLSLVGCYWPYNAQVKCT